MNTSVMVVTAAVLRSEIAARRLKIFQVAGRANIHPVRLGKLLNERLPLPSEIGARILAAIRDDRVG